ncbi:MAG: GntR family transcriptional regulator [Ancalomicrobiaceae bacterium]|nr:GntR family transcriptional regulator [Ancalomicrobiaceae bacterium]
MKDLGLVALPDRNRPEPLWHQAEQTLRALIANGTWPEETQLPNEERLSQMLGISRITVRHALRNIEESGLLRREHGRGTFVRSSTVIAGVRGLTSFTQEMASLGLAGSSHLLEACITEADETTADALEIRLGEPVVRLRRLRLGNGAPIGIQTAHLPAALVPDLVELSPQLTSLYEALRSRYGVLPKEAREVYRVGRVPDGDAELLGVPAGSPAFIVERITFGADGPFEFAVSTMRGDRYEIRAKLYL